MGPVLPCISFEKSISFSSLLKNGFIAIKDIKILNFENYFLEKYSHISKSIRDIQIKVDFLRQIPRLWIEFFAIFLLISFVYFFKIANFLDTEIIKILGLAAIASFKLLPSLNKIIIGIQQYKYGSTSFVIIKKELQTLSPDKKNILSQEDIVASQTATIEFKNLSFRYPYSRKFIFKNVNIKLKAGDFVGISGPSGCGKSTLSDVLLGILPRTSGQFYVNHKSYRKALMNFSNVAYVSQHIYLFDEDIIQNIIFGTNLPVDMKKIWNVLKIVNLDHFVNSLPKKLNTKISDRGGANISGGQRQRLAIARALYSDPKILILDEATSALDIKTENSILRKIKSIFKNKIIINVTHKKSYLNSCNKIYEFILKKDASYSLFRKK
jgi:ABC-type bacteriocin/lantibiotic exporter with double-glycine peptidase domain